LPVGEIGAGKFIPPTSLPITQLSAAIKKGLPTEIIFAQTGGELIDFNVALTLGKDGEPQQQIETISGKPLFLSVKPDGKVKSVKGYLTFKSRQTAASALEFSLDEIAASLFFVRPVLAQTVDQPIKVEEKLILSEFEYTDQDKDGIYTAQIQAPITEGQYEIITVMDYENINLGKKEIRLIAVVDPEGYVFKRNGDEETRVLGATVSIFWLNPASNKYEQWPAKDYQQENPQITDITGKYSFLVPEGDYYLRVEAPRYLTYESKPFKVSQGSGIHFNVELKSKDWWLKIIDWKLAIMIFVIILLLYNFYRDKKRDKLLLKKI
jgi:hypothetical protein